MLAGILKLVRLSWSMNFADAREETRLRKDIFIVNIIWDVFPLVYSLVFVFLSRMARGQQKIQSQAKAAEKSAKLKKQQGHSANDQKKAAQKALVHVCSVCKVRTFIEFL